MIPLIVAGACGRMGQRIMHLAVGSKKFQVAGAFESPRHPNIGLNLNAMGISGPALTVEAGIENVIRKGAVVIDFTHPDATLANVKACEKYGKGIVIGTTGLNEKTLKAIRAAGKNIPVVQAPNMSAGVNLLFRLVEMVAEKLNDDYDIEIVEAHHRYKKDAPSGTALELAMRAAKGRKLDPKKAFLYGREGLTGERSKGVIGIHAVRGGDVVGDHTVSFLAEGERVELTHKASSRDAFAKGALLAAEFAAKKKKGFFTMQDVLGI